MLGFTLFFSLIFLFSFHYSDKSSFNKQTKTPFSLSHLSHKEKIMIKGFVFGEKPRGKKIKKAINNLHIHHLFTPSGLHLSSLLWFLAFFSFKRIAVFSLLPLILFIDGFFALKRIYFIKFINEILIINNIKIDSKYIFLFVFSLEFIFRSHLNPLSFTYSFLFIGIIYSLKNSSPLILTVGFWLGQSIIASFTNHSIYLLSLPLNTLLTFFTTLSYPLILLNTLIPMKFCSILHGIILTLDSILVASHIEINPISSSLLLALLLIKKIRTLGLVLFAFMPSYSS